MTSFVGDPSTMRRPRGRQGVRGPLGLTIAAFAGFPNAHAVAQPLPPAPAPLYEKPAPRLEAPTGIPAGALQSQNGQSLVFVLAKEPEPGAPRRYLVRFREEATRADYFTENGGGSLTGVVEVDCGARLFQLQSLALYARNNLAGELVVSFERRTEWRQPRATTVLGRVIQLTCATSRTDLPPVLPVRPAPPAPVVRIGSPPAQAAQAPRPPEAPRGAPPPLAPGSSSWVQVAAGPTRESAERFLTDLRKSETALLAQAPQEVSAARVRGTPVFRSLLGPYPERRSAADLCLQLTARGHACFVRVR